MIDYWCNAFTPDREPLWRAVIAEQGLSLRTRVGDTTDGFATAGAMVDRMDRLGIATLVIPVCEVPAAAPLDDFGHYAAHVAEIRELAAAHPARFVGAHSVDPGAGTTGIDAARSALGESWCVALHSHTHSFGRRFDHPDYSPYYELCAEHGVPFVMQAGASGGNFPHECGHPEGIAAPATMFPSVPFVLSHTGAPWVAETIAAASEYANVHVGTATHPPRRWPADLVRFISGPGATKALFGTGFPLTGHDRSLGQLGDLNLDAPARHALLDGNARRIFTRIPDRTGG